MKLFIDIETVPVNSPDLLELFKKKFAREFNSEDDTWENFYSNKAALFAEFGKIVCVSMGFVVIDKINLKSFCSDNEKQILEDVSKSIDKATSLVAHNGKDFDYPLLCRRMIINGVRLPSLLQIQNLKPWEIKLEDTIEMWKFGQFNHKASLALMCELLGVKSPKGDMDGSKVAETFNKCDFKKIESYCEGDVVALINVYRKLNYQTIL